MARSMCHLKLEDWFPVILIQCFPRVIARGHIRNVFRIVLTSSVGSKSNRSASWVAAPGSYNIMSIDRRKALLYGSAATLRLLLFLGFPSLAELLTGRVEISTPVTSFKRLQEGLFLYTHNVSPYDGGVFHQAPLLLPLFALVPRQAFSFLISLLYIGVDLLSAECLIQIAKTGESRSTRLYTTPRKDMKWDSVAIGAA